MLELFPQYTGIVVLILALIVIFRKYILRFAGRYVFLKPIDMGRTGSRKAGRSARP